MLACYNNNNFDQCQSWDFPTELCCKFQSFYCLNPYFVLNNILGFRIQLRIYHAIALLENIEPAVPPLRNIASARLKTRQKKDTTLRYFVHKYSSLESREKTYH